MALNQRKVAMVGCGSAGAASCFALMQSGLFSEMVLIDSDQEKAEGEAMDLAQGLTFARPMKIYAGTYKDLGDAAIVIVTASAPIRKGDTRLELVKKNVEIFENIIPEIAKWNEERHYADRREPGGHPHLCGAQAQRLVGEQDPGSGNSPRFRKVEIPSGREAQRRCSQYPRVYDRRAGQGRSPDLEQRKRLRRSDPRVL